MVRISRKLEDTRNILKRHVFPQYEQRTLRPRILGPNVKRVETWCGFEQLVDARVGNGVLTRLFYNIFMMMILLLVLVLLIFTV